MGKRFSAESDFKHGRRPKIGVLITNLGTPDAPEVPAVKRYLKQFLSDPRVVEIPRAIWWCILKIVLLLRPKKSAAVYQKVWTSEGSPLLVIAKQQLQALKKELQQYYSATTDAIEISVELGMRYGNPALEDALVRLRNQGCEKLLVLPLYPQYSGSTTGSTFDALAEQLRGWRYVPELIFINQYFDHPAYIQACAEQIKQYWQQHQRPDKLVFSYHGVPQQYLLDGDPYHCHCHKTTRLIAQLLEYPSENILTCFQSRFGKAQWLQPYTDKTLESLGNQGIEHIGVFCPGFSADCLETLEEIEMENKETFLEAGGKKFDYIPALNSQPHHLGALVEIITPQLDQWQQQMIKKATQQQLNISAKRALELGAKQ